METDRAEGSGKLRSKSRRTDSVKDADRIGSNSTHPDTTKHSDRLRSQSTRHDRVKTSDRLRSGSTGSATDRTRTTEQLRSDSEGKRRSATQSSKQLKTLEGSTTQATPDNHRLKKAANTIVAARKLFDRIDIDGSGTLERDEIAMLAMKMVHHMSPSMNI